MTYKLMESVMMKEVAFLYCDYKYGVVPIFSKEAEVIEYYIAYLTVIHEI